MHTKNNLRKGYKCEKSQNTVISILQPPPPSPIQVKPNRKKAFTLAETLVTLMIIGVVAALTIPALSNNTQRKSLQSSTKKAFSVLNQGIDRIIVSVGYTPRCYYNPNGVGAYAGDCALYWREFQKAFNVTKYCPDHAYQNGCIPPYKGIDTVLKEQNPDISDDDLDYEERNCGGFFQSNIRNNVPAYVLADGQIVFPYDNNTPIINVDVNGQNGPNKWGYDIFSFIQKSDGDAIWLEPQGGCGITEKGGVSVRTMLMD